MKDLTNISSAFIVSLLDIIQKDFGEEFTSFVTNVDVTDQRLEVSTSYTSYVINFIDEDKCHSSVTPNEKRISISKKVLMSNPHVIKYFIRRQFIADKELSNLYLRRGKGIRPNEVQEAALTSLQETRNNGFDRALVVLATGLGKTILSALDARSLRADKILFIVHINEILRQTKESFEAVMPERKGETGYYTGKQKDKDKKILFASIQTMGRQKHIQNFSADYFDYIIIDETHHTAAPTYTKIFDYFKPKFFLGLTATPDRMDGKDILGFYDNNVVFEMNQQEGIEQGYLTPFQYHGFKDNIDYSDIYFNGFRYDTKDLNKHLLIDERDKAILKKFNEIVGDRKTIGFCASIEHAERCVKKFREAGISSIAVHSQSEGLDEYEDKSKEILIKHFREGKCQVAFVVDMFNEGVDIPDVSCLLFLRPTESKTIFIQHLGRGLRIAPRKEDVLVLDFVGNYRTANAILEGLGIKDGIRGLKKINKDGKDIFVYQMNDCEVTFDSEIIDIFRANEALYTKEVKTEVIDKRWIEYSDYLEKWTKDNLYWKRGQQNQYFEVNFEALRIIKNNPGINEVEFIAQIQKIVEEKYPNKNMTAGFRALILSKISGFVSADSPLRVKAPFNEIDEQVADLSDTKQYETILTNQLEKIFYWNPIYGSYNKYIESTKRVSFKDFKIYPFFFIYDVMIRLVDDYGSEPFISRFEFNTFLSITKEHSEARETAELILRYRDDVEIHQVTKFLDIKNKIDPRFYGIVHYCKYFKKDRRGVFLKDECIDEVREKVKGFRDLCSTGKLIIHEENSANNYKSMLYSNSSLLDFHKTK